MYRDERILVFNYETKAKHLALRTIATFKGKIGKVAKKEDSPNCEIRMWQNHVVGVFYDLMDWGTSQK